MASSLFFVCLATAGVAVRVGLDGLPPNFVGLGVADKTKAEFSIAGEKAAALPPAAPADALMETNMSALEQLQDTISQKQLEELIKKEKPPKVKYARNAIFADLRWKDPAIYPDIPQVLEKFNGIITSHLDRPVNVMQFSARYFEGQKSITITPSKGYSQTLVPEAFLVEEEGLNGKNLNYYAVENDGSNHPKHLVSYPRLTRQKAVPVINYTKDAMSQKQLEELVQKHKPEKVQYVRNAIFEDLQWKGPPSLPPLPPGSQYPSIPSSYPQVPQVLKKFKSIITNHLNRPVNVMLANAEYFQGQESVTIIPSQGYSQTLVPNAFLVEEEGLNYYAVENDGSNCPKHLIPWLSQEGMKTLTRGKESSKKQYEKQAIAVIKYKDANKITDYVKKHLGAVDKAKYKKGLDDAHWKNGAIAIQFNEDMPDFYPIDGGTYSNKYTKISEATFAQKNPELLTKLSLQILGDQTSNSWEYLQKTGTTSMYKLSDLGRVACKDSISKRDVLRIESPWGGTQDKKVGVHAFLVEDGTQFYMVNGDSKDCPLYYKEIRA